MKIVFIILSVLIDACVLIFLTKELVKSHKMNKNLEAEIKKANELALKREEQLKEERELFQATLNEKDKLKVDADEKKRKIRTGNKYDNYINGLNQLRNSAEEGTSDSGKS